MSDLLVVLSWFAFAGVCTYVRYKWEKKQPLYPSKLRDGSIIWVRPMGSESNERVKGYPAHWYPDWPGHDKPELKTKDPYR